MTVGFVRYHNYANLLADENFGTHAKPQLVTDVIKLVLIDLNAYAFDADHQDLADIPSGARVDTVTLDLSLTDGLIDCVDPEFTGLDQPVAAFVIYLDSGAAATSTLLAFCDENAAGEPIAIPGDNDDLDLVVNAAGLTGF